MNYSFIAAHAGRWPLRQQCRVLQTAASGYYAWQRRRPSRRALANAQLAVEIRRVCGEHKGRYGSPRVCRQLRAEQIACSRGRVARLMRQLGLRGRTARSFVQTTQPGGRYCPAQNELQRDFQPGGREALAADITALRTEEGWLYLAVVLSVQTRRVLGWSTHEQLHGALGSAALRMALARHSIPRGTLHHSDRGGQYTSGAFQRLLRQYGLRASMSRPGNCYDNAVAESFFATLKRELGETQEYKFANRQAAQQAVYEFIEGYYNSRRMHERLGYLSPEAYAKLLPASISPVH